MTKKKIQTVFLSNGNFLFNIPLDKEQMDRFREEMATFFSDRGESIFVRRKYPYFFSVTTLSSQEVEKKANEVLSKILKRRRNVDYVISRTNTSKKG